MSFEQDYSTFEQYIDTQRNLVNALAEHFGIPLGQVIDRSHIGDGTTDARQPLIAVFHVALLPEDLFAAVERIKGAKT